MKNPLLPQSLTWWFILVVCAAAAIGNARNGDLSEMGAWIIAGLGWYFAVVCLQFAHKFQCEVDELAALIDEANP